MLQNKSKQIQDIYQRILGAIIVILGVLFIWACLDIYTSGPRAYSAEAIAQRFSRISIPVYITIAAVFGGIAIALFLPSEEKKSKSPQRDAVVLQRLKNKVGALEAPEKAICDKEIRLRRTARIVADCVFFGLLVYPAVYLNDATHFSVEHLNADIIKAVIITMVPALLGLTGYWIYHLIAVASMRREIACYKKALVAGQKQQKVDSAVNSTGIIPVHCVRGILLAVAALWILLGVLNGGAADVLKKAIAICTECIGLG